MEKITIGLRQVLDQELGLGLLSLQRRDIGNRFDDVSAAVGRIDLGPLNEEVLIVWKRDFTFRRLAGFDGLRHLAKLTGRRTAGDLFVTGMVRNISELGLRRVVLKDDLVCVRIDDGDDHRLRIEEGLRIVLRLI